VGDYSVRVYAGNRDMVTRRYAELFDRHRNPLSDEFQQEKRKLEGLERYLVQLWRESLAARGTRPAPAPGNGRGRGNGPAGAPGNGPASGAVDWPAALLSTACPPAALGARVAGSAEPFGRIAVLELGVTESCMACWPCAAGPDAVVWMGVAPVVLGRGLWPRKGIIA
jgi:hypothetical protein